MIAKLKKILFGTAFRQAFNTSGDNSQVASDSSTAERIGPNRVILNARMNGMKESVTFGYISTGVSYRGFSMKKPDEETIIVPIENCDNDNQTAAELGMLEKRATLNVKTETKFLTINFTCNHQKVIKSERIRIK